MKITCHIDNRPFQADLSSPVEVSMLQSFDEEQPQFFAVPLASSLAVEGGGFIGDTARGGSCNVRELHLTPHCNGTHTESIAHICNDAPMIHEVLREVLVPATLLSVPVVPAITSGENYTPSPGEDEQVITAKNLRKTLAEIDEAFLQALLLRTLPNEISKQTRNYDTQQAPYFSTEAMQLIGELPVKHLIVDLPSLDRSNDGGLLSNHRLFWRVPGGVKEPQKDSRPDRTISEFAYFDDSIVDGSYLAAIQIPPFSNNAAPSRIFIYPIEKAD